MLDNHMQPIRPVARLHREFDGDLRPAGVFGSGKAATSALAPLVICSQPRDARFAATNLTTSRRPISATAYRVCTP
jgi:hypothetical protein